jgi:RHS repeat-associated protein
MNSLSYCRRLFAFLLVLLLGCGTNAFALSATSIGLTSSINPSYVGQTTTLSATVQPSNATGTVTFKNGTATLGKVAVAGGVASLVKGFNLAGSLALKATYSGDAANSASTSASVTQVVVAKVPTSVSLTSGNNPSYAGQLSTLTAVVTGSNPTGAVTFKNGAVVLGKVNLSNGAATLAKSFATAGNQSITAAYGGDTVNAVSVSSTVTQSVLAKTTATVLLDSSPNPSVIRHTVTLSATVSGSYPSGTVTFKNGTATLGRSAVVGGVALLSRVFTVAGVQSLTAIYGGDLANSDATSPPRIQTVQDKATTTVSLSSDLNPSFVRESVTLSATVLGNNPSGTVTFKNGASTLGRGAVSNGVATWVASLSSVGVLSLTADYLGDSNNIASISPVFSQTVQSRAVPTVTLSVDTNPANVGQVVNLKATLIGNSPSGVVSFLDGTTTIGTGPIVNGVAVLSTSFSTAGTHRLKAVYTGDVADTPHSSAVYPEVVKTPHGISVTDLSSSANPSGVDQAVILTANVTGLSPTGVITFKDGSTVLGTASLGPLVLLLPPPPPGFAPTAPPPAPGGTTVANASVATISFAFPLAGTHNLTAVYPGDASNSGSTSAIFGQVVNLLVASTTSISVSPNPAIVGQSIRLVAQLNGRVPPTGRFTFMDGATTLGSATYRNGDARISVAFTTAGSHAIRALFAGDTFYAPSTSIIVNEAVVPWVQSSVNLTISPNPALAGTPVQLTANVVGLSPSGVITFLDGANQLGTATLNGGIASLSTSFTTGGAHQIVASYAGDISNGASDSNVIVAQITDFSVQTGAMTWRYGYDPQGNLLLTIDPNSNQVSNSYDSLYRLSQIAKPAPMGSTNPTVIGMAYDQQDNLTQVVDPRSLATNYTVDGLSNVRGLASPDTGISASTYDAAGNLLTKTDSRGMVSTYSYDALNRLTRIDYSSGTATQFEYDGGTSPAPNSVGRLTKITDESGSTAYTYDTWRHVLTKTQTANGRVFTVSYTWGSSGASLGHLTGITYPSGASVNYAYDSAGRVNAVSVGAQNGGGAAGLLSGITYNAQNAPSGWTWSDGVQYQRTFDSFGRLSSYPLGNPAGSGNSAGLVRTLSYDAAGQIVGFTHTNVAGTALNAFDQVFAYDNLGQLNSVNQSAASYGYTYDASGNRTMRTINGTGYPFTVAPDSNRLTQAQSAGGSISFTYDNAGNMLADSAATYVYSARGRMSSAAIGSSVVSYLYNGLNQRVSKTGPAGIVPSGVAFYVYDEGGQLLGEYDVNGAPIYETAYLGAMPVGVLKPSGGSQVSVYNVYSDHLNTPRVIAQSNDETIVWRWDNAEAFGATPATVDPSGLGAFTYNQRFPGQIYDVESGNFYNWWRDYRPAVGRYAQSDPIGLKGGVNTFSYANGNPLTFADPKGLMGGSGSGAGARGGTSVVNFFGCMGLSCITGGMEPTTMSVELTLGGGIEICDAPPPPPPPQICKDERGVLKQLDPPDVPVPERLGGAFFSPGIKRDGRICLRLGVFVSPRIPLPSLDLGPMEPLP